jgi:hypothetical protein
LYRHGNESYVRIWRLCVRVGCWVRRGRWRTRWSLLRLRCWHSGDAGAPSTAPTAASAILTHTHTHLHYDLTHCHTPAHTSSVSIANKSHNSQRCNCVISCAIIQIITRTNLCCLLPSKFRYKHWYSDHTHRLQKKKVWGCIEKFPDCVDNEINKHNNNKHTLRSNTKGYGGKTHRVAIQQHQVAQNCTVLHCTVLAPGGKSGNFWIHPRIMLILIWYNMREVHENRLRNYKKYWDANVNSNSGKLGRKLTFKPKEKQKLEVAQMNSRPLLGTLHQTTKELW